MTPETQIADSVERAANTLLTIEAALPTLGSVSSAGALAKVANERGYLKPDEDDAIRELFSTYLRCRSALISTVEDLRPLAKKEMRKKTPDYPEVFIISFAGSTLLLRAAHLLIDTFSDSVVATVKLNEAEPRYGIQRKQFTRIYRSATSVGNLMAFLEAKRYWSTHRAALTERFQNDPLLRRVIQLLERDEPWIETSKSAYLEKRLRYRLHSFLRRHHSGFKQVTFALFKMSGKLISELHIRWLPRRKRVSAKIRGRLAQLLQPGDVIVTRHDDAATNLFLPGFWPHAALYIGTDQQRLELGLDQQLDADRHTQDPLCVLEALKDGVRFRPLSSTLSVDACTILRPKLSRDELKTALARAMTHEGKEYDFEFDFRRSDKLVCTEVIYRAYHQCGPIDFDLQTRAGRVCLSAEDLLDRAIDQSFFKTVAIYGFQGNRLELDNRAETLLEQSYQTGRA